MDRLAEQLGGLRFGDCPFGQGAETQALETKGACAGQGPRLPVWRTAPAATGEFVEQQPNERGSEDPEVLAAVGERLHAHAKDALELEELAPAHGLAVLADLGSQGLGRHEERASEAVDRFLVVNLWCSLQNHVAEFMREREALAFAPIVPIDDHDRCDASVFAAHPCREPVDVGKAEGMRDPRFVIEHGGDPEYSLATRTSDGQMLFLANKVSKMKRETRLGSRIAEVHNGSSLFTGDAGQGESNIRRWIIENDWLEAIVALPLNLFYNTGIATYVWVLTNHKPAHRGGKVQLIDATGWHRPLRKNLDKKNCELGEDDIARICATFLAFGESERSRIFDNAAFGYWKVTVERPLRIEGTDPNRVYKAIRDQDAQGEWDAKRGCPAGDQEDPQA